MLKTIIALLGSALIGATAVAAPTKFVCKVTGKESTTCCCEQQKDGKLLCKYTGKTLDKCCCTTK